VRLRQHALRLGGALFIVCASSGAHAGLFNDDEAREWIRDLRNRTEQSNRSIDARLQSLETTVKSQGLVDLFTNVEGLKEDLARLRGQIESEDSRSCRSTTVSSTVAARDPAGNCSTVARWPSHKRVTSTTCPSGNSSAS